MSRGMRPEARPRLPGGFVSKSGVDCLLCAEFGLDCLIHVPEYGLDCLICAEFARQRNAPDCRGAKASFIILTPLPSEKGTPHFFYIKSRTWRTPRPESGFDWLICAEFARQRGQPCPGGQQLHRNVQRFRGGLVFKAHRLLYHSTLGLRVMKKKKTQPSRPAGQE